MSNRYLTVPLLQGIKDFQRLTDQLEIDWTALAIFLRKAVTLEETILAYRAGLHKFVIAS